MSERLNQIQSALDRLADGRLAGRVSAMITIGRPALALKQAQQWAQRHGSEVALWRGGGLCAALDGVGAALAGRTSSKQVVLARILPASNGPADAVWVSLDLGQRERLLA